MLKLYLAIKFLSWMSAEIQRQFFYLFKHFLTKQEMVKIYGTSDEKYSRTCNISMVEK